MKARLDYFLISKNTAEIVVDKSIDRACMLSDHRTIHLHLSSSPLTRGRGFWRLNNDLLKNTDFIAVFNKTIADTMKSSSKDLKDIETPTAEQCSNATFNINSTLLHDVILMEARAFALKFTARKRKEENLMKDILKHKIEKIQDTVDQDDAEKQKDLKRCLDDLEKREEEASALKTMAKYNLEVKSQLVSFAN